MYKLLKVYSKNQHTEKNDYPFSIPLISNFKSIEFKNNVSFFVGENGSGKSTLLEAVAKNCGFGKEGGGKYSFSTSQSDSNDLSNFIGLAWKVKTQKGFFLRAETFFNLATYIDQLSKESPNEALAPYGGKSLHQQSHGESFLSLFKHRFRFGGLFLMDEPEAALSPQRQLSLMVIMHDLIKKYPDTQFIIATHSPILLAYPNAQIFSFDSEEIDEIKYEQTNPYQITQAFLSNPQLFFDKMFQDNVDN